MRGREKGRRGNEVLTPPVTAGEAGGWGGGVPGVSLAVLGSQLGAAGLCKAPTLGFVGGGGGVSMREEGGGFRPFFKGLVRVNMI